MEKKYIYIYIYKNKKPPGVVGGVENAPMEGETLAVTTHAATRP